jgi:thiol-disulfide isomerase/thioredoxin
MSRASIFLLVLLAAVPLAAQESASAVAQAIAQGDLYQSKKKFDLALDAYHKADKLSHHTSALCYLKIASVERKLGDFSSALDNAKHAVKAAGEDKTLAIQAHLVRATLLTQMSGKPTDKKLKEAEAEIRQALALDPAQPRAHFDLGVVLLKQERDAEGLAELNAFVSSPGGNAATVAKARRFIASPIRAREPFAPDFSFVTHENKVVSNASLRGKVALLDFWGTWCPPCRASVPTLRNLQEKFTGKDFQLVSISSDGDEDVWRTFVEAQHMDWAEYIDLSGTVQEAFGIDSFPTYLVLDKDGVVRFRQSGFGMSTQEDLENAVSKALKRAPDPALAAAASAPAPQAPSANASSPDSAGDEEHARGGPDASSSATLSGIETGTIAGNAYKNEALGLSYEFPDGWIAAKPEALRASVEQAESAAQAAILQQHPELAGSQRVRGPRTIFYASQRGQGDGLHIALPCVRITAVQTSLTSLNLDLFRQLTQRMAAGFGISLVSPAAGFTVKNHAFARADFERILNANRLYEAYIQTLAGNFLVTFELFAASKDELQQISASLQSISISEGNP